MGKFLVSILVIKILATVGGFYQHLPRFIRTFLGFFTGRVIQWLGLRSRVMDQNLLFAFPDKSKEFRAELKSKAYIHLGQMIWEGTVLFADWKKFILKETTVEGIEHWQKSKAEGKPVIMLSSHVGNWEMMAAGGSLHGKMEPLLVTKHLKPEWFHKAFEKGRAKALVQCTYEPHTTRAVLAHLKRGKTVGIVLDQYAGPPFGIRVPFFGIPVGTHQALAVFAKRTGAAVHPVYSFYDKSIKKRRIVIEPAYSWLSHEDPQIELALNTEAFVKIVEGHVRKHPEEWLWSHRRFKGDLSPLRPNEWSEGRPLAT